MKASEKLTRLWPVATRVIVAALALGAAGLIVGVVGGFGTAMGATDAVPSPTPTPSAEVSESPTTIVVERAAPSNDVQAKDLLVPIGTLLGAALGFGGAVTGARMAANAQENRAQQEAGRRQQEEERTRSLHRLDKFADEASSVMGTAIKLSTSHPEGWGEGANGQKDDLRLSAAQLLATGHLLDAKLASSVQAFVGSTLKIAHAATAADAKLSAQECGASFEGLMKEIGKRVQNA